MRRVRAGEPEAAEELVRSYEPEIRREVRLRLSDPGLRRVLDSMDICQSVLGNFFARAALGQFELDEPRQLVGLLLTMVRNRVTDWARKQRREAALRDAGKESDEIPTTDRGPGTVAADRSLVRDVRARLSAEELRIADLRLQGSSWSDVAAEVGAGPEAVRKRFERSLDRAARELKL